MSDKAKDFYIHQLFNHKTVDKKIVSLSAIVLKYDLFRVECRLKNLNIQITQVKLLMQGPSKEPLCLSPVFHRQLDASYDQPIISRRSFIAGRTRLLCWRGFGNLQGSLTFSYQTESKFRRWRETWLGVTFLQTWIRQTSYRDDVPQENCWNFPFGLTGLHSFCKDPRIGRPC